MSKMYNDPGGNKEIEKIINEHERSEGGSFIDLFIGCLVVFIFHPWGLASLFSKKDKNDGWTSRK